MSWALGLLAKHVLIMSNMIIYTNEGNPLGLKLLVCANFAKIKNVELKIVNLSGKNQYVCLNKEEQSVG